MLSIDGLGPLSTAIVLASIAGIDDFSNHKKLVSDKDLPYQYAKELGLDLEKLDEDMNNPSLLKVLENERVQLEELKERKMIDGTILINKKRPSDYSMYSLKRDRFEREVDTYSMIINKLIRDSESSKNRKKSNKNKNVEKIIKQDNNIGSSIHTIPLSNSVVIGELEASITIMYFFDFQ